MKLWYVYKMEYYSAIKKNTIFRQIVELETIILSVITQSQKDKYHMLSFIFDVIFLSFNYMCIMQNIHR